MVQLMPVPPIISRLIKNQNGSAFLVPAYPHYPEKEAVKRVSVLCLFHFFRLHLGLLLHTK